MSRYDNVWTRKEPDACALQRLQDHKQHKYLKQQLMFRCRLKSKAFQTEHTLIFLLKSAIKKPADTKSEMHVVSEEDQVTQVLKEIRNNLDGNFVRLST